MEPSLASSRKNHPELKKLKHVMRCDKTGLMTKWYDLGLELLDSNASILDAIRDGHQNDADKCCTEMFKEWLACKPDASWDELITSLNNIKMNTAASNVLKMISNDIQSSNTSSPSSGILHDCQEKTEKMLSIFISNPRQARTEFAIVLSHIEKILQTNERQNLDTIKSICGYLPINRNSDKMFSAEQLKEIDACSSIRESFRLLRFYLRWDDHLILTAILDRLGSEECEELLGKYESKIDCQMKLEQIYKQFTEEQQEIPTGFSKMVAIVNKKYSCITKEDYDQLKGFISKHCGVEPYVLSPFVKMTSSSVLLEWMIPPTAVTYMVEMASKNKSLFIKASFTFFKIDNITTLDIKNEESYRVDDITGDSQKLKKNSSLSIFQTMLSKQIDEIATSVNPEDLVATLSTLTKIFDNIIQHPNDDKYRQIKLANKTFSSKVWRYPACEELMKMSGWVVEDDHVRLRNDSHVHIVSWLLRGQENTPVSSSSSSSVANYSVDKYDALISAVLNDNIFDIQNLLKPCNVSTVGMIYCENGSSANLLHLAILSQKINVVKLLIRKYFIDPYVADDDGKLQVFLVFSVAPQSFIINLLEICGVNLSCKLPRSGFTLFHHAVCTSCFKVVCFLVEKCGMDVNVCDNDSDTPLHIAYMYGQTNIAEYLIQHGADVMAVNSEGLTPYHYIDGTPQLIAVSQTMQNCRIIHGVPGSAEYLYFVKLRNIGTKLEEAVTLTMKQFPSLTEDGPIQPHHDVDHTSFTKELTQYITKTSSTDQPWKSEQARHLQFMF